MPTFSVVHVFMFLMTVVRGDKECSPKPITCHAGMFAMGEPAAVSCNLHADMKACKLNVSVVRYSQDDPSSDPGIDIVSCRWNETTKTHNCRVDNGYDFHCDIGENPKLEIPSVGNDSAGYYMCYIMSADDLLKNTHVCKLSTRDRPRILSTTTLSLSVEPRDVPRRTLPVVVMLLTLTFLMAVGISILTAVVLWCRHQRKRYLLENKRLHDDADPEACEPMLAYQPVQSKSSTVQVEAEIKNFRLENKDLERVVDLVKRQLEESTSKSSTTCLKCVPIEREAFDCLVVVLSGTFLKVMLIKLQSKRIEVHATSTYNAAQSRHREESTLPPLAGFITSCVVDFANVHNLSRKDFPLGMVFSFPCEYPQDSGQGMYTVKLSKPIEGFDCVSVIGKNLGELLQQALQQNTVGRTFEVKVVVNDAVGVLRAAFHQDERCNVAIVLGNRYNACYLKERGADKLLVTTDCGSFGDCGRLDIYMTDFDRMLDEQSTNKGEHILDKMISGAYTGEIVRVVLVELRKKGLLFKSSTEDCGLFRKNSFPTEFLSLIESDTEGNYHSTQFVLRQLGVESFTNEDCEVVKHVGMVISERAAHLAAAGLAAIIKHMDQREVTVALDSSPYLSHPRFVQLLEDKTKKLLGETCKLRFRSCSDETGKGAALLAAAR